MIFGAVALLSGSFALMIDLLRRAPVGYQDETGFHFSHQTRSAHTPPREHHAQPSRRAA